MQDKETDKQGIFGKIMSVITGSPAVKPSRDESSSEHSPQDKEPEDVRFVRNFTQHGGYFLYCGTKNEIVDGLLNIVAEHHLTAVGSPDPSLVSLLKSTTMSQFSTEQKEWDTVFTNCEALIAFNGGIMINEFHTGGLRIDDLPKYHIVFGRTSQLVESLSDAMTRVNHKHRNNRPFQSAVLKGAKDPQVLQASADPNKNRVLFLLLIEDSL